MEKVEFGIPEIWEPFIEEAKKAGRKFYLLTTLGGQKIYGGFVDLFEALQESDRIVEPHVLFDGVEGFKLHEVKYREAKQRKLSLLKRLINN